ncbi:MAG: DUF3616 domain-containing protein [Granulosicoccus sp.]
MLFDKILMHVGGLQQRLEYTDYLSVRAGSTVGIQGFVSVFLMCLAMLACASDTELDPGLGEFQSFSGLYEPSGVIQLQNGRLLVIEDESSRAFVLLSARNNTNEFDSQVLKHRSAIAALLSGPSGPISDLEGLVQGPGELIYAITSHSRQSNGKRDIDREKLVRLTIEGDRVGQIDVRTDLRKALINYFPVLEKAAKERDVKDDIGLNIEGLAMNRSGDGLWIGFRGPLIDDNAVMVTLLNPDAVFESDDEFSFKEGLQLLDLDEGGIRDLVFDAVLDGYLIVSQREGTKREKAFKLWFWNGYPDASPRRVRIKGVDDLQRTEGIASVTIEGQKRLLLVSDEGDVRKRKPADVLLVDYEDLEIEE